jgi:hypothetical protein
MPAITGKGGSLQIGIESVWGTSVTPTVQMDLKSESLKDILNLKEQDTLVGRRAVGAMDVMNEKVTGDISIIVKPDNIGEILYCTAGVQSTTALQVAVAEVTEITIPSGLSGGEYFFFHSPSVDYCGYFTVGGTGSNPSITGYTSVAFACPTATTSAQAASVVSSAIHALATFSATVTGSVVTMTAATAGACVDPVDYDSGCTFEVITAGYGAAAAATSAYTHVFTPLPVSSTASLPHFTAMVDRVVAVKKYTSCKVNQLKLDAAINDYLRATISAIGRQEATGALAALSLSTAKPFKMKGGEVRVNGYVYANVTDFKFTWDNSIEDDLYVWDGSGLMAEIEPRELKVTAEVEVFYDTDTEAIRESYFKAGNTVNLRVYFQTETAIETGYYNYLIISIPLGYITEDPAANLTSPDRIKMKLMIRGSEGSSTKACTITLGNARATDY